MSFSAWGSLHMAEPASKILASATASIVEEGMKAAGKPESGSVGLNWGFSWGERVGGLGFDDGRRLFFFCFFQLNYGEQHVSTQQHVIMTTMKDKRVHKPSVRAV